MHRRPPGTSSASRPTTAAAPCSRRRSISKIFGGLVAVNDVDFIVPAQVDRLADRPQRRGQDDVLQLPDRALPAHDGARDLRRQGHHRQARRPRHQGRRRAHLPEHQAVPDDDVDRERAGRDARRSCARASRAWCSARRSSGARRRQSYAKARELLNFVGLKRHNELAMNLPYGDQRRLEIARALASDPQLLLLDEPTAGMNPQESEELRQLMETLRTERGISVLLIEHDMKVVMNVSDHITVLDHGEKIAEGAPAGGARRTRGSSRPTSGARHDARPREPGARQRRPAAARGRGHPHVLRLDRGAQGHLDRGPRGRDRHAHRRQRRRQVDDAALDLGHRPAAHGPRSSSRATRSRACAGHEVAEIGIAQSPEGRRIFPRMTVLENLEMGAFTRTRPEGHPRGHRPRLRPVPAPEGARAPEGRARCPAASSRCSPSGRALMAQPKLLLLDEPSLGLAPVIVDRIYEVVREINAQGVTILLVEQNANYALDVSARGYVLETGPRRAHRHLRQPAQRRARAGRLPGSLNDRAHHRRRRRRQGLLPAA